MSIETNVNSLIINKMSESKYSQITPIEGQMYATPDTHIATKEWTESRINDIMNSFNTTFNEYKELMKPNSYFYRWNLTEISAAVTHEVSFTCKRGNPIYLNLLAEFNPKGGSAWLNYKVYKNNNLLQVIVVDGGAESRNSYGGLSYLDRDVTKGTTYTYKFTMREAGSGTAQFNENGDYEKPVINIFEL